LRKRKGDMMVSARYDEEFETLKWVNSLPYLSFPADWLIKIVPPFVGAVIRFRVKKATTPANQDISIYFDGYNNLGMMGGSYWEIFPWNEDTARFKLGEEAEMLEAIEQALKDLEKNDETD